MESLGEYIKRRREEMDYSLREFARKIDITATFLSDIEKGTRHPSDEVLEKIAEKLDDSFEKLKELDNRVPIKELKELFNSNPKYGFAFRKLAENKISPDELLRLIDENKNE
jgi:transcriptional regulator with XRE-family HTH domain